MARQTSSVTIVGKFGNMVGYKGLDGKYNAGIYVPGEERQDSKTPEQVYQRARLALAAKVAGMLGVLGEQVNVANGLRANRRGALVRQIMGFVNDGVDGPELAATLSLVKMPKGSMSVEPTLRLSAPTAIRSGSFAYAVSCTADNGTLQRVIVALLVYNKTKAEWRSYVRVFGAGESMQVLVYIPAEWAGDNCFAYGYTLGVLSDPSVTGVVSSIGSLEGTTTHISVAVDSDNVAYGALCFTQVDAHIEEQTIPAVQG